MSGRAQQPLSALLLIFGLVFIFGVWPLMLVWPAGWVWQPNQPEYQWMILGVYATLGVFVVMAARDPSQHRSLILFTAWSSIVHAAVMLVEALRDASEHGHFLGDIPILAVVGILLLVFAPKSGGAMSAS
jgi:Family of unknown function (DUF6632)